MSIQYNKNNRDSVVPPLLSVDIKPFDTSKLKNRTPVEQNRGDGEKTVLPGETKQHRKLTGKEQAYLQYRIEHPLATKPEAIKAVYDVKPETTNKTMRNMASIIEKRPAVLSILTAHAERSEQLLTELMEDTVRFSKSGTKEGAQYAGVAERTINSVLDRVHGKAKQTLDVTSKSVNISVDLASNT